MVQKGYKRQLFLNRCLVLSLLLNIVVISMQLAGHRNWAIRSAE